MKKTLLLIFAITLYGCSSNEDSNLQNENFINPPSWIQGTWVDEKDNTTSNTSSKRGFIFMKDDWCIALFSKINEINGQKNCQEEKLILANINNIKAYTTEEITNEKYFIEIVLPDEIYFFEFSKISSNEISIKSSYANEGVYTKVF
ncbi:MAG: hypothetical protein GW772_11815 [Flavobacteriia bacterium]|nr:hypothetical protein [Flavobacteriia bacterium]OIP46165.1 MAG: hypothetical protein AUK46_10245 [Flavobacteriaceae bacterium CG2_30_31_66]PIV97630.1 MAG: hypothetical protein COW43_02090 [Flavobacteriaceae bacterium CG17_big_fil_post_rev_8_21_14_2_50_31_13]PIX13316.1 MAG: hypothetical protein COZ74_06965 [Flavobacteriaceae bacterium CG_4_8_14_3_um_filter_31_8]PIZ10551.1 MAG: hypothetical protein COY55_08165 [Flavobacteriaceae bacterium CG_4_10_14_0_8_um_filter_31_99]PJC09469.1 MAG: hypothet